MKDMFTGVHREAGFVPKTLLLLTLSGHCCSAVFSKRSSQQKTFYFHPTHTHTHPYTVYVTKGEAILAARRETQLTLYRSQIHVGRRQTENLIDFPTKLPPQATRQDDNNNSGPFLSISLIFITSLLGAERRFIQIFTHSKDGFHSPSTPNCNGKRSLSLHSARIQSNVKYQPAGKAVYHHDGKQIR